ncbi:MAG: SRPBCC domain-containing protein [Bacteroidota bacterium]
MRHLETEITIDAPIQPVWKVLTDLEQYPKWNPFIQRSSGVLSVGERIKNEMHLPGQKPQTFRPKLLVVDHSKELRWLGSLGIPGLFDGEHYFRLEATGKQQTRLIHGEHFRGLLVGLIMRQIGEATKAGFVAMNEALKHRAEEQMGFRPSTPAS